MGGVEGEEEEGANGTTSFSEIAGPPPKAETEFQCIDE